jgi:HK97 family phage major capsid protein
MSVKDLYSQYRNAGEELRSLYAAAGERDLTAEEQATEERINANIDGLQQRIARELDVLERDRSLSDIDRRMAAIGDAEPAAAPAVDDSEEAQIRSFLRGERRSLSVHGAEQRVQTKLSAGAGLNTVNTSFYDRLVEHMIEVSGIMMAGPTVLRTNSGESLQVPKTTAHGTAALIAENASITASDSTFGQATLGAYKYARLVQVSNELVNDTAVDLLGYLARDCGRSVGNAFGAHAITGTGSSQPAGVATGASTGVTGAASVVGAFNADNLIDLFYSVISPYRSSPSCGWLMRDATVAAVRKLKDTTNQYLWQPSMQIGAPETLLGKPLYTDPNVAAVALSAKSVLFGDMSAYFVRMVNDIRFERSDDFAFSTDLVTFRCILRADGVLVDQTGAVKAFVGNAA